LHSPVKTEEDGVVCRRAFHAHVMSRCSCTHMAGSAHPVPLFPLAQLKHTLNSVIPVANDSASQAWVRLIDCLYAIRDFAGACDVVQQAEAQCQQFTTCPEYKSIIQALKPHLNRGLQRSEKGDTRTVSTNDVPRSI
jgi:hypothetical protein